MHDRHIGNGDHAKRQLRILAEIGVTEVVITTGYYDSVLIEYCNSLDYPINITFVNNPRFAETNYIYSIYCARDLLKDEDIILKNMIHVVINNGAHETVGGMPTVAGNTDLVAVAKACNYPYAVSVDSFEDLDRELDIAKSADELCFIEVKCAIGARADLGRPTTTALENKENFMNYLISV